MNTYGNSIVNETEKSVKRLRDYINEDYLIKCFADAVVDCARNIEVFLKRYAFPLKSSNDNFYNFIEELRSSGIDALRVDALHNLRKEYNNIKHDPSYIVSALSTIRLLEEVKLTLEDINGAALGHVGEPVQGTASRVFWICSWDHYVGGETEVSIFLPSRYDGYLGAHALDRVSIKGSKWDDFIRDISERGSVHPWEGHIDEAQVRVWQNEGDCLTPFVFEGEYKTLINVLSRYVKDVDLIPGLAREDDQASLLQASAMIVIDSFAQSPFLGPADRLSQVMLLASQEYGILERFAPRVRPFAERLIAMIEDAPSATWTVLSGPVVVDRDRYNDIQAETCDDAMLALIDSMNRIVLGTRRG
ncbi:hypothetical protein RMR16_015150 [Agrobacterium sp. rho-13.3]|uniref:hypothetical protein n=1 Tax=Agrobacterium sp. rho-13.3 TaxID=3072980 RepID=UPI002A16B9BC|nr:hypothetical protein [Agrobacterium sp. rho-13.3]MDX8311713.1 hypothetical protein [Agrobacterium sp. rho-13.3]